MPYKIFYDRNNYIVKLKIFSIINTDEYSRVREETLMFCKELNCPNLLIDLRFLNKNNLNLQEYFEFGKIISKRFIGIKVAYILSENSKFRKYIKILSKKEQTEYNIFRDFKSIKNAIDWFHKF
jgi:hypothetical protein